MTTLLARRTAWESKYPTPKCELRRGFEVYVGDEKIGCLEKMRGGVKVTINFNGKSSLCEIKGKANGAEFVEKIEKFIDARLWSLWTPPSMPEDFMI